MSLLFRIAGVDDVPQIVEMGRAFYAQTHYGTTVDEFCADSVAETARQCIAHGAIVVADVDGQLAGMVGAVIAPFLFNRRSRVAHEVMWWVAPDAQGLGIGRQLLASIESVCRELGADVIQMIHLQSSPPQAAALYHQAGYVPTESSFTKRLT